MIQPNDIFIDPKGNFQKCLRIVFFSDLYKENLFQFHTGKMEYESTVKNEWMKKNYKYLPGQQLNLFESPDHKPVPKIRYVVRLSSYYNRNQDDSFRTFASEEAAKDCLDRHIKSAFGNTGYIIEKEN